jgi:predicted kinase
MTTTLHLLCGKIAAGKSTLAAKLAAEHQAVLLREDHWLATLYAGEITSVADYVRCAQRMRGVVGPLVVDLLARGMPVVLDFPANREVDRTWLAGLAEQAGAQACLHFLDVDDDTCKARLHARNAQGEHEFAATDAEFELITQYFSPPGPHEQILVIVY